MAGTQRRLLDELVKFIDDGKIIIGILARFQLLIKTGLLPATAKSYGLQTATRTAERLGTLRRPLDISQGANPLLHCIFTYDMDKIYFSRPAR